MGDPWGYLDSYARFCVNDLVLAAVHLPVACAMILIFHRSFTDQIQKSPENDKLLVILRLAIVAFIVLQMLMIYWIRRPSSMSIPKIK